MHFVQALTLFPEFKVTHCKLGCFLTLIVGLYFPLSFLNCQTIIEDLPHRAHSFAIVFRIYLNCPINIYNTFSII